MIRSIVLMGFFLMLPLCVAAQVTQYGLPRGAKIIEQRAVPQHPNRALLLWMRAPKKNPLEYGPEEYTCPDATRGSYYRGPTRVSLVDKMQKRIINTLTVNSEDEDSFDVPYKIKQGIYYDVPLVATGTEGLPAIISYKDYNGDGVANEFALFDALACMGLQTALFGYSEKTDRVINYPILLTSIQASGKTRNTYYWIDYLFSKQPIEPRHWKYEIDYRGRGGTLDQYDIRYNAQRERFEGTLTVKE